MVKPSSSAEVIQPGQYQHFKGEIYHVICVATHSETGETFVVYHSEQSGQLWVRPASMFNEEVEFEGRKIRRFERIREIAARYIPEDELAFPLEACY